MKLVTTIKTILTREEWDILYQASGVLNQLHDLLEDYNEEAKIVNCALNLLEEVMQDVIDDYEF